MANKLFNSIFLNKNNENENFKYSEVYQERLETQKKINETLIKLEVCEMPVSLEEEEETIRSIAKRYKK